MLSDSINISMQLPHKQPIIYEINTATFLQELSVHYDKPVTFANVPDEVWDGIAAKNITMIWFMGVWKRSDVAAYMARGQSWVFDALPDATDRDVLGSAYSIKEYEVDERFGGDQGLATARQKLRDMGIQIMLDYVPNHVAIDHPWVREHPEYFILGTEDEYSDQPDYYVKAGENIFANAKDPNFPPWSDVLQLNALSSELREAAQLTVMKVASQCDAVRCDMAMLMLNNVFKQTWGDKVGEIPHAEFWSGLIQAVRSVHPDFIFVAEVYWKKEQELLAQGFDFCYDKELYDELIAGQAKRVASHIHKTKSIQNNLLRFIENHDEERAAHTMSIDQHKASAIIMSTLPGARMYHDGQFEGLRRRVPVQLGRRYAEPRNDDIANFYSDLLSITGDKIMRGGRWEPCFVHTGIFTRPSEILAWRWKTDDESVIAIVNFSSKSINGRIVLSTHSASTYEKTFGNLEVTATKDTLRFKAAAWEYALLKQVQKSTNE